MNLSNATNLYLQLGVSGATLFIMLVFVVLLFRYMTNSNRIENTQQVNSIEKLCSKIDELVASNGEYTQKLNEVLITSKKDNEVMLDILRTQAKNITDIQKKVTRIDDRTYSCINVKHESKDDNKLSEEIKVGKFLKLMIIMNVVDKKIAEEIILEQTRQQMDDENNYQKVGEIWKEKYSLYSKEDSEIVINVILEIQKTGSYDKAISVISNLKNKYKV